MQKDHQAFNRAIDAGVKHLKTTHYQSMRDPVTATLAGVRPWPAELTAKTVASWIAANVSYSMPSDAHDILEALVFENNA